MINILAFTTTFKLNCILFCKFFGFTFFKAKLSSVDKFDPLTRVSGLSLLVTSLPLIIGASLTAYHDELKQQLFVSSIDAIVVTTLMLIFMICEGQKKPSKFFDDQADEE